MKTSVKQLAAGTFIALLLLVGNVKANESKASSLKTVETNLELENWMTDETIWNINSINIAEYVQETETDLILESWMTNEETWNLEYSFVEEAETAMELEGWMIKDEVWNANVINNESELTVEPWMINNNFWE